MSILMRICYEFKFQTATDITKPKPRRKSRNAKEIPSNTKKQVL